MTARFTLAELVEATQARVINLPRLSGERFSISTDSRKLTTENVFLPLVGERFDGHDFLASLKEEGVSIAFCEQRYYDAHPTAKEAFANVTLLLVEDTLDALQDLAHFHRKRSSAKIIGLTGSSGKSTMKEYLFHVFKQAHQTQATFGNHNNDIGVAQTLLAIEADTEIAIVEMGMRGLGQIRRLTKMAEPDLGLLINIGPAHIELLGTLENTAIAKCELVEGVKSTLVSNGDDPYLEARLAELPLTPLTHLRYQLKDAQHKVALPDGTFQFTVEGVDFKSPLPGEHQVSNVLGVITVANALGVSTQAVADALASFASQSGRFERIHLDNGNTLINDAYNANPTSMKASLDAFFASTLEPHQARVLILGSMKELGEASPAYHAELVESLKARADLRAVIFIGEEWQGVALPETSSLYSDTEQFLQALQESQVQALNALNAEETIAYFLKGSRFHALERLIPPLESYKKSSQTLENTPL
ncbi:MAG: UDP-N-acetylmuramoyl-tripeptide--D-alanyl-D-alanine ligase [Vampirovibrionales bacterium]|jgi:UDP-N-acetylmuramoyl-tripeptide--D-alanyl-D-alanine ligase|nr:UDP-N-acetylmuramoyl-tripeptide--D-alanyl-D-alanine ligase [Vampirovibrionales bacterium]